MFIAWRRRPIRGEKEAAFFLPGYDFYEFDAWRPLVCRHRGAGRVAWTPLVLHAVRDGGRPRQKLVHRFASIRSCCLADPFVRAAWWHEVAATIAGWQRTYG